MSAIVELVPGNIFMRMHSTRRWMIGLIGLGLLAVSPYLWQININFLWLILPMLGAWAIWLVIEYLRWTETLSRRQPLNFDNLNMNGQVKNDRTTH
jgi:purine-cytosine permease-like protein